MRYSSKAWAGKGGYQMQHKVITVIKREYITRVKTKGFLASILLMPVMMFIVMVLPSFMMTLQHKSDEIKNVCRFR